MQFLNFITELSRGTPLETAVSQALDKIMCLRAVYGTAGFERIDQFFGEFGEDFVQRPVSRAPYQNAKYVFPGISAHPWHSSEQHESLRPLISKLELSHREIKSEIATFLKNREGKISAYAHHTGQYPGWKAIYLYSQGVLVNDLIEAFPRTIQCLQSEGSVLFSGGEVHFSILEPGMRIPLHSDGGNISINLHFAVTIPEGCALRVANETRNWIEGRCLLFDYSFEHEAWNDGANPRICLLADLWHPDLTNIERYVLDLLIPLLQKLFAAAHA